MDELERIVYVNRLVIMRLSNGESDFVISGVEAGVRADGRGAYEFRNVVLETGLIPSASGSARAQVGNTDVLAGVKTELGGAQGPDGRDGALHFSVEFSSVASIDFEGRGASSLNAELAQCLDKLYSSRDVMDRGKLCLIPGRAAWTVYVDIIILQIGGNILDAASIATRAALLNTQVARVEAVRGDGDEEDELEIDDDPGSMRALPVGDPPVWISLFLLGSVWIADADADEEFCMNLKLSVGVNSEGKLCGMVKGGTGALEWPGVGSTVEIAHRLGVKLISSMNERQAPLKEVVGFFG